MSRLGSHKCALGAMLLLASPLSAQEARETTVGQDVSAPLQLTGEERVMPSLMFSETDIKNLTKVVVALKVRNSPNKPVIGSGASEEDILNELLRQAGEQEAQLKPLPEFYLASMLYRSQGDWKIWLTVNRAASQEEAKQKSSGGDKRVNEIFNNVDSILEQEKGQEPVSEVSGTGVVDKRISLSSKEPKNEEFNLSVESISRGQVTLAYKPEDQAAAYSRYQERESESPRGWRFRNRLVDEEIAYDVAREEFVVTIRINQTFSADMMRVVEGKTVRPKRIVPALNGDLTGEGKESEEMGMKPSGQPISKERAIADELINNYQKIQQFMPVPAKPKE